jgi:signal transduction histidine kinase
MRHLAAFEKSGKDSRGSSMDVQEKTTELREEIAGELKKSKINYGRILELSSKLSELDPDFVRFTVDAGHISRLGKELVGRQETAVSELVKNAYDADARLVTLTFCDTDEPGGCLKIWDNGHGMTREQLIAGFMRLSTADKIHYPFSPIFNRPRAGRKGIGRFAAQRLGNRLTLITKATNAQKALKLKIDWRAFEKDQELSSIANRLEEIESDRKTGTTLIIKDLCDAWTESQMRRVYRYVADLIQPFPLSKKFPKNEVDPGFKVTFYRKNGDEDRVKVVDEESEVFDYALAEINGFVDETGYASYSLKSTRLKLEEKDAQVSRGRDNIEPFSFIKDIHFKTYYFIYKSELIPGHQLSRIQEFASTKGGIRLYRNGFRVLPYGEPYNDWLRLDASNAAREILPAHSNSNFFGYIEIYDPDGIQFEETASREGLIENPAFHELTEFVHKTIKAAVLRIAAVREKKQTAGQKDWKPAKESSPIDRVRDAANKLRTTSKESATEEASSANFQELAAELESAAEDQERREQAYLHEIGMLRVLASLGLTIGQFTHEIRHNLTALHADLNYFQVNLKGDDKSVNIANRLKTNFKMLQSYASYFDSSIAANVRREMQPQELRDVINRFTHAIEPILKRSAIDLKLEINGFDLYTKPMHPSEWASILFNFLTNAKKAIARANTDGKILIRAGRDNENLFLEFADNGDGIPPEIEDRIFDAFFTTSSPAGTLATSSEEIVGTGLGLKIVKDIIDSSEGSIYLIEAPKPYVTCFRIDIPCASEGDINNED